MPATKTILLPALAFLLLVAIPSSSGQAKGGQPYLIAQSDGGADYRDNSEQVPPQESNMERATSEYSEPDLIKSEGEPTRTHVPGQSLPIDGRFLLFGGLLGMFTGLSLLATRRRARRLSEWARNHKRATWGILTVLHLALGTLGFLAGKGLHELGFVLGNTSTFTLLCVFGLATLLYPLRHATRGLFGHSYGRHKLHDLVLVVSGLLLMVSAGNQKGGDNVFTRMGVPEISAIEALSPLVGSLGAEGQSHTSTDPVPDKKGMPLAVKILLTLLSCAILIVALYVLVVISCYIACSGAEALAWVVLIGGLAAIIIGLVMALRAIWGRKKRQKTVPASP